MDVCHKSGSLGVAIESKGYAVGAALFIDVPNAELTNFGTCATTVGVAADEASSLRDTHFGCRFPVNSDICLCSVCSVCSVALNALSFFYISIATQSLNIGGSVWLTLSAVAGC